MIYLAAYDLLKKLLGIVLGNRRLLLIVVVVSLVACSCLFFLGLSAVGVAFG